MYHFRIDAHWLTRAPVLKANMDRRIVLFMGLALSIGLTGCGLLERDVAWPEVRPLGRDLASYRPLQNSIPAGTGAPQLREPTGDIALRQALAYALIKNPELAAFAWEVRAGEARTLQASLFPNPELEVETEEFGGDANGFDVAETTIQLSQLIELGGKRGARTKVAALERNLAGWNYESKRLDVFTETSSSNLGDKEAQKKEAIHEK